VSKTKSQVIIFAVRFKCNSQKNTKRESIIFYKNKKIKKKQEKYIYIISRRISPCIRKNHFFHFAGFFFLLDL